jgi:Holliday junction resolvase-like predicted endonuclease
MRLDDIFVKKYSGKKVKFSVSKLSLSLIKSGADKAMVDTIVKKVSNEVYDGISTKEIYNRAFVLLKGKNRHLASKYKLKRAIYELGPTGFPFERFISRLLRYSGYTTENNVILKGKCVTHEIDVIAKKENITTLVECKYHNEQGLKCNIKIPLYIQSRYLDVKENYKENKKLDAGWVVTNTKFTEDAIQYGICSGLYLLSWNYPVDNGLKDRIDRLGLYPITVSTLLTKREKQFLINRDVILCRDLKGDTFYLDKLEISDIRKKKILSEINKLCN